MYATPDRTAPSAVERSPQSRIIRFQVAMVDGPASIVPLRCDPVRTTVGEVMRALVARLDGRPDFKALRIGLPSAVQLRPRDSQDMCFRLNVELNALDALECYIEDGIADCDVILQAPNDGGASGSVQTLADTASAYASHSKRLQALKTRRENWPQNESPGPETEHSANGGAVATAPTPEAPAGLPKPTPPAESKGKVLAPRPPPQRRSTSPSAHGPSGSDRQASRSSSRDSAAPPPRRSSEMYGSSPVEPEPTTSDGVDNHAASSFKMALLFEDCFQDESSLRRNLEAEGDESMDAICAAWRLSVDHATYAAIERLECAHRVAAQAMAASVDDFFATESRRFRILTTAILEEQVRQNPVYIDVALRENKSEFVAVMEATGRQEIETLALESWNRINEDFVLCFTREVIQSDERFIEGVRELRSQEETARESISNAGLKKQAMFLRQFSAGVERLKSSPKN